MKMMTRPKFKYTLSILNVSACIGILILIVFSIINWEELSREEGWGLVAVVGLGLVIISGFIIDSILQIIFRNKRVLNIIGAITVLIYLYAIFINP